ncbi:MAG: efflux RND transporter periplasmic adaptor subunit [Phycisphaerales bacterium]|nr:MAG: efflux RND transporter periplasmic adaptor subunit [Phycisphaerales bacterium]
MNFQPRFSVHTSVQTIHATENDETNAVTTRETTHPLTHLTTPRARRRAGLLACCIAAAALLAGAGCDAITGGADGAPEAPAPTPAVPVKVVKAWSAPLESTLRLVGTTRAVDTVRVTSEVSGVVVEINFQDEDLVEAGDILVRLDDRRAAADLRAGEARVERARLRLRRVEGAYERGGATLSELEDARTDLHEAEAERDRAGVIVENHVLRAPFGGRVARRNVSMGAYINPGDSVTSLTSVDPIEIVFSVPEMHLARLRTGLRVGIDTPAFPGAEFEGRLRAVGAVVDVASRTAEVFAHVPNPEGRLRPGMFGGVTLVLDTREDAVLVPESSLLVDGQRVELFIVENGEASRVRVRIGERRAGYVEILEGVRAGDVVVSSGLQRLRDGAAVNAAPDQELVDLGLVPAAAIAFKSSGGTAVIEPSAAEGAGITR